MKLGDLITLAKGVPTNMYLSEIAFPEGFIGLVIGFTREDHALTRWYNEIYLTVPSEGGRVIRLLLTSDEMVNNFVVIT
jgi:hypothetical protein